MTPGGLAIGKIFEGFGPVAYQDEGGVWTLGYGETHDVEPGDTISEPEAAGNYLKRLTALEARIDVACSHEPTANQLAAMALMADNCGMGDPKHKPAPIDGFLTSSILRKHNAGDFAGAAASFGLWVKDNGKTIPGLQRRRAAEAKLYLTPDDLPNGKETP